MAEKYCTRTEIVTAARWTGDNVGELVKLAGEYFEVLDSEDYEDDFTAQVFTAQHSIWEGLAPGDWVVRDARGWLHHYSAATFDARHTRVPAGVVGVAYVNELGIPISAAPVAQHPGMQR